MARVLDYFIGLTVIWAPALFWMMILVGVGGLMGLEISPAAIAVTGLAIAVFQAVILGVLRMAKKRRSGDNDVRTSPPPGGAR